MSSISKYELIKVIENKLEEVKEKMQQVDTIKDYYVTKLSK
ncbi:MAG: hypothetical protein AAGA16_21865 [Cyanobacteria bacterium P01_E01_bin.35]